MESRGPEPVPGAECIGHVRELLPNWTAANIGALPLTADRRPRRVSSRGGAVGADTELPRLTR
ncbi:hypothetical protein A4V12_17610 [Streptomyces noursei]|nr:hypothetical protein A4V12_17610 [Streptomyces noursei]